MKIIFKIIIIVLFCFLINNSHGQAKVDTSAIDIFWEVTDTLSLDKNPSTELWKKFSHHPAYVHIQQSGNRVSYLKKVLPIVFKLSNREKLNDLLIGKESFYKILAKHFVKVKSNRIELTTFIETLDLNRIVTFAPERSLVYLPKDIILKNTNIPIYIALFERDNGFGGKSIVLDPVIFMKADVDDLINFVAHEYHHSLRPKSSLYIPLSKENKNYLILEALGKMPLEGVASILDNDKSFDKDYVNRIKKENPLKYREVFEFIELIDEASINLAKIDSILAQHFEGEITVKETSRKIFNNMPWGGHTVGFYMAKAIGNNLGKDYLIVAQYNPVEFMLAYHKATLLDDKLFKLSKESIRFIKTLN